MTWDFYYPRRKDANGNPYDDDIHEFKDDILEAWQNAASEGMTVAVTVTDEDHSTTFTYDPANPTMPAPPWVSQTNNQGVETASPTTAGPSNGRSSQSSATTATSGIAPASDLGQTDLPYTPTGPAVIPVSTGSPVTASTSCTSDVPYGSNNAGLPAATSPHAGDGPGGKDSGPGLGMIMAAAIIPILFVALLGFALFIILRRRRRQQRGERDPEEMKMPLHDDESDPPPGSAREASPPPQPQVPPPAVTPTTTPPPVIISSINPAGNSAYFTGIDTSEALSVRTNSVRSGHRPAGFMMDGEFHEEPPPPYRPRSVPPISRNSSMREPNRGDHANSRLLSGNPQPTENPFADPTDDDAVSIVSDPFSRRHADQLSVVSDISYQNEPTIIHQAV